MLSNVKKTDRVKLANGMMATVTEVQTSWGQTKVFIRPDGGLYKTRAYNTLGKALDGSSSLDVAEVMAPNVEKQLEEAKAKVAELSAILEKKASDGYEEKLMDFGDGKGEVLARRHLNPEGDFGGYVATTASVDPSARIGRGSTVFGNAQVGAGAKVKGNSRIGGNARIGGTVVDGLSIIDNYARRA